MVFEIEHCNLVYKLGMVTTQSEQEILFEIVSNYITSYSCYEQCFSDIFKKQSDHTNLISHPVPSMPLKSNLT